MTLPAEATDVASALHAADRRMYAAKHSRSSTSVASQMRDVLLAAIAEQSESIMEQAELTEHMLDVGIFARDVARQMDLEPEQIELTLRTGELHDVGKIAIPESILHKPGPLNDDEWLFVRKHTLIGERVLSAAPALVPVAKLVRSTHERFDGGGYPDGLDRRADPAAGADRVRLRCLPRDGGGPPLRGRASARPRSGTSCASTPGPSSTRAWSRRSRRCSMPGQRSAPRPTAGDAAADTRVGQRGAGATAAACTSSARPRSIPPHRTCRSTVVS